MDIGDPTAVRGPRLGVGDRPERDVDGEAGAEHHREVTEEAREVEPRAARRGGTAAGRQVGLGAGARGGGDLEGDSGPTGGAGGRRPRGRAPRYARISISPSGRYALKKMRLPVALIGHPFRLEDAAHLARRGDPGGDQPRGMLGHRRAAPAPQRAPAARPRSAPALIIAASSRRDLHDLVGDGPSGIAAAVAGARSPAPGCRGRRRRCGAAGAAPRRRGSSRRSGSRRCPMSRRRVSAPAALLVCSVEKTRWPVSAAWMAICAVSRSRISPIRMMSGSWRSTERSARAKVRSIAGSTCSWVMPSSRYSTGSSTVKIFTSSACRSRSDRVERRRLAAAGRAGHQDDAVRHVRERAEPRRWRAGRSRGRRG